LVLDGDSNGDGSGTDYAYLTHNTDGDLDIVVDNPANAGNIKFFTNSSTERLRIDSTGRVAVNQPAGTGSSTGKVHIKSSASNIGQLYLEQNNATDGFMINQDGPNGGHLKFIRDIGGTQTVNVLFRSDRGICFNGDTAAANALDDYEEGSFTPTLTGGGSLTNSGSYYTKIGRFINFYCYITALNIPNNNNAFVVSGLPYVVASGTFGGPCSVSYAGSANDSRIANIAPNVQSGNNYIYFHSVGIGQGYTMNNAHFQVMVNGNLNIQGCYITTT